MKIRTVKTSSESIAVQVVEYVQRKTKILSHIGSARNEDELFKLKQKAILWINNNSKQSLLFKDLPASIDNFFSNNSDVIINSYSDNIVKEKYKSIGSRYQLLYDSLINIADLFGFRSLNQTKQVQLFLDLVIARIVEPESKFQSLLNLQRDFAINHQYRTLSRNLKHFSTLKDAVELRIVEVAKSHFGFDFNLVFYDLTTLYFESFKTDEVRKIGFSKDNKSSNPQVMIGLLVNSDGFPISYQVFSGNKFEGHTLLPSILDLKKKYKINNLTLVADSAMLSDDNINLLEVNKFGYIVASRTANLKIELIQEISKKLNQQDKATIRITTKNKGTLICSFCKKRYNKEKIELEKQIEKANHYLKNPNSAEIIKRAKFLKNSNSKFELNQTLIIKYKLLLGIKGYHTNREDQLTDNEIINRYKNLWQVEKAFRISKTDLKIRPIYHHEECAIKAHLVICFTALAMSKYIEIKTKKSIKSVIRELKTSINSVIINKSTNQQIILESEISDEIKKILKQLNANLSY